MPKPSLVCIGTTVVLAVLVACNGLGQPPVTDHDLTLCGSIRADRTLDVVTAPYVLCAGGAAVRDGALLTVDPGVTVLAAAESRLRITSAGALAAVGTADDPIAFRAASGEPGGWGGIWIESDDERNELRFVDVAYGGAGDRSNLELGSSARVVVTDSVFRDGADHGLRVTSSSATLPGFARNEFRDNLMSAVRIFPQQMRWIDGDSTFADNGDDVIEVPVNVTIAGPETHVWSKTQVPFAVSAGFNVGTHVEVGPGFRMWASGGRIRVQSDGSISAVGSPLDVVVFTARPTVAGTWGGFWIESADERNEFAHVEIAYGGATDFHNILLGGAARLEVRDSLIRDSAACGIRVPTGASLDLSDVDFENNAGGSVCGPP